MKFEKLLEKYRAVCTQRDELRAQLENRDQQLRDVCAGHAQFQRRVNDAIRIMDPQPKPVQVDQVNEASGPRYFGSVAEDTPRMGSPKTERVERPLKECPHCHSLLKS